MKRFSKILGSLILSVSCALCSSKSFAAGFQLRILETGEFVNIEIPDEKEAKRKFEFAIRNNDFKAVKFFRNLKIIYNRGEKTNAIVGVAGVSLNDWGTMKCAIIHSVALIKNILETGSGQILAYNDPLLIKLADLNYNLVVFVANILDFLGLVERPQVKNTLDFSGLAERPQ